MPCDEKRWTVMEVLNWAHKDLEAKGIEKARLDAEVLLGHSLGLKRLELYTNFDRPLTGEERTVFRDSIVKRRKGLPVAYITGTKEFYSRPFKVTNDVLIPRPETELLVEEVINYIRNKTENKELSLIDVGTGSGCIAITLALELQQLHMYGTDISAAALKVARENNTILGSHVTFFHGNLLESTEEPELFDGIVSNPPYVEKAVISTLTPEVQNEPALALDGGNDGLDLIKTIVKQSTTRIKSGGFLFMEIGHNQGPALKGILKKEGYDSIIIRKDYSDHDRIAFGIFKGEQSHGYDMH